MRRGVRRQRVSVLVLAMGTATVLGAGVVQPPTPEELAVDFLSIEVPRWPAENGCFSCHNNGDAARALYTAVALALPVADDALRDTTEWLSRPDAWDANALGLEFSDKTLARIQFGSALVTAIDAGRIVDLAPLSAAARMIAGDQQQDGSWRLDSSGSIGSPATYGTTLATWAALTTLERTGSSDFLPAIERGNNWLQLIEVKTVLDAAAVVLALGDRDDLASTRQRHACLDIIVRGRAASGGWGAYLTSPTEAFDTAVVVLALAGLGDTPQLATPAIEQAELDALIAEGRAYLLAEQLEDGSWIETTRPAGQQSYAQYVSTTGWATLALLATAER